MDEETTNSLLAWAIHYATVLEWSVIPISQETKLPLVKWKKYQEQPASEQEIRSWWRKWPKANIGLVTGAVSGVVVLDVDGPNGEPEIIRRGGIPPTAIAVTSKGKHFYFLHPGHTIGNGARILPDTDFRGDGGYVVLPPSIHASGHVYAWEVMPLDEHSAVA